MISNDEVAGFVKEAPDRLVGVGSVDISRPMDAVRETRRCVEQLGFKAIRVLPWLWELPPTHAWFYPVYIECCELAVPFCTQVGHTGPLKPSEYGHPIPYIDQVALDFPELIIVGGHIGYPWTEEMIAVCTKHPNVYIDTSAYTVKRYPPNLISYMARHGRTKVMFGTNWPMIPPKKALEGLDEVGLDEEAHELFLSGNAARVFKLKTI
jgi:predicted TIM-barrel fold metal-dependent hydrolase